MFIIHLREHLLVVKILGAIGVIGIAAVIQLALCLSDIHVS